MGRASIRGACADLAAKVGDVYRVSAYMRKAPDVKPGDGSLVVLTKKP